MHLMPPLLPLVLHGVGEGLRVWQRAFVPQLNGARTGAVWAGRSLENNSSASEPTQCSR